MRTILGTLAVTFALVLIAGAVFIFSGLYDVSATAPHWRITYWIMETERAHSIEAHAAGVAVPPGLDDPTKILMGTEHFAAHCAVCHGAPGVPKGDIAHGLYPQPPNLAEAAKHYSPGELFWILKHGIKMSGMPAWNDHSDEELWATVAFLEKLPGMSEQDYAKLVMSTMMQSGGHHHDSDHEQAPPAGASRAAAHSH
jgi:mono/diheme cytochrome c family protein